MDPNIFAQAAQTLNMLSEQERLRTIPDMDHGSDLYLEYKGKKLLNLASNNYLGLSGSDILKQGSLLATKKYGTSSTASRLISGCFKIHAQLENELCLFKKQPRALTVGSGYMANLCILAALAGRGVTVFSDRLNHASIVDAAVLSRARLVRYRHADMDHLGYQLKKNRESTLKILVTDTVFSMDGDTAPLEEIVAICKNYKVLTIVDEAHATGVLGQGRGLAQHLGLEKEIQVHMGTFSKALGSYGGYIAAKAQIIDLIINRGRPFVYSTSLPPAVIGASLAALDYVNNNSGQGEKVLNIARRLRIFLQEMGFDTGQSSTQIIPVILKKNSLVMKAWQKLMTYGVFTAAVRPPTVPENTARLRLSIRADLGEAEIETIKQGFALLRRELEV